MWCPVRFSTVKPCMARRYFGVVSKSEVKRCAVQLGTIEDWQGQVVVGDARQAKALFWRCMEV